MNERIEVDVDHTAPAFNTNELAEWNALRARGPVVWNTRHGGFWMVTGFEEAAIVSREGEVFAHRYEPGATDGIDYIGTLGIPRPAGLPGIGLNESDGARHLEMRRALGPFFSPQAVSALVPFIEHTAQWFLDQRIADGAMDVVADYTGPIPALVTLKLMGLPLRNWKRYSSLFHLTTAYAPGSREYEHGLGQASAIVEEVLASAERLRREPRGDLTSFIANMRVEGKLLDHDELVKLIWNFLGGGVDTTTSSTSWTLHYLATRPALRGSLIAQPGLWDTAAEEFIRFFSVAQTLSRTVTRDTVLGGQPLRRGDWLLLSYVGANHDAREFDRADEVLPMRSPNRHLAFGSGPHRCIGAALARTASRIMLERFLARIPDYTLESPVPDEYLGQPTVTGLKTLPIRFAPGAPAGVARPY
ncbi:MAG: cytochrome P450 [Gammaproteobacteria bacterium]